MYNHGLLIIINNNLVSAGYHAWSKVAQVVRSRARDDTRMGKRRATDEIQNRQRTKARPRTVGRLSENQRLLEQILRCE